MIAVNMPRLLQMDDTMHDTPINKLIIKRNNLVYTHQLGIANGQHKGFILDEKSKIYYITVRNKTICGVFNTKLQTLADSTKKLAIDKLMLHIGNTFNDHLGETLYVFEVLLGTRDTTFIDILYRESEYLKEKKYRDRLNILDDIFKSQSPQMKILDVDPILSIEPNCSAQMIIRSLLETPNYSNEYKYTPQQTVNFVVVGQGAVERVLNLSLKAENYTDVRKIPNNVKSFLAGGEAKILKQLDGADDEVQLKIYNKMKNDYLKNNETTTIPIDQSYRTYLVGGNNGHGGISIFGITKSGRKLFTDDMDLRGTKEIPNMLEWENVEHKKHFKPDSIIFYQKAFNISAKQIHRKSKSLSIIKVDKITSSVNLTDIKRDMNLISLVPLVQINKKNNEPVKNINDNELFGEAIKRLHLHSITSSVDNNLKLKRLIIDLFKQSPSLCRDNSLMSIKNMADKYMEKMEYDHQNTEMTYNKIKKRNRNDDTYDDEGDDDDDDDDNDNCDGDDAVEDDNDNCDGDDDDDDDDDMPHKKIKVYESESESDIHISDSDSDEDI